MSYTVLGVIPARYASTRFPGKPLADIAGKSMIRRVYEQAQQAALQEVVVATDDERILEHVLAFGGRAVMTRQDHQSGTDRCFEAYCLLEKEFDFIVNVQGDEPFIQPGQINELIETLAHPLSQIATLARKIESEAELLSPNVVKVARSISGQALYFSRHPIPYFRGAEQSEWLAQQRYLQHIGLYGYRTDVLEQLVRLPVSELEKAESLEQLRWLEDDFRIAVALTSYHSMGIDTPEDLARATAWLSGLSEPQR